MKITDYTAKTSLNSADVFLTDGANGTMKITALDLQYALFNSNQAMHRTIYRAKNQGSAFTAAQKAAIADGSFNDLWVGDYWAINGVNWRIVDMNYYISASSSSGVNVNHLVIMPDLPIDNNYMNSSSTSDTGYVGSDMFKTKLNTSLATIQAAFGSTNNQKNTIRLSTAANAGNVTSTAWTDVYCWIPNEINMYGSYVASNAMEHMNCNDNTQFSLFKLRRNWIYASSSVTWLRDICGATTFSANSNWGDNYRLSANNATIGIRPAFCIA